MLKQKQNSLIQFIQSIKDEKIIDSIQEVIDSQLFSEIVARRSGLIPIWVVFDVHTSMQFNKYRTDIREAFKTKSGISDYLSSIAMTNTINHIEIEIVFIEKSSNVLFYSREKNNLNYYNFGIIYRNESEANRVDLVHKDRILNSVEIRD
jgi:hypothetical protein